MVIPEEEVEVDISTMDAGEEAWLTQLNRDLDAQLMEEAETDSRATAAVPVKEEQPEFGDVLEQVGGSDPKP